MAYTTSDGYKEVIYSGNNDNNLTFKYGEDYIEDSSPYISSLKLNNILLKTTNTSFSLDNFVANEMTLVMHNYPIEDLTKEFYFELGSMVNDNYEYVPIGYYKIKDNPTTANGKTTYKLFDRAINFDFNYDAEPLITSNGGSVTILQLLQDMCSKANVELATTDFLHKDKLIGIYDNSISARTYVSYIAELACSIAKIGRDGKLYLIPIKKMNNNSIKIDEEYINQKMTTGDTFKISKVMFESGIVKFEQGDDSADTLFINASNPFISTQEEINDIYNQIVGFEIMSLNTSKILGNISIDPYDFIEFDLTDENNEVVKNVVSLGQYEFEFNGVMFQTFRTTINRTSKTTNSSTNTPTAKYTRLRQEVNALDGSLKIVSEKTEQIEQDITTTKQANGYPITIEDAGAYPLQSIHIDGKLYQETRLLPSEYTQVDYLQSNKTQYIDTGFKPNQDTRVKVRFESIQGPNEYYDVPFGTRNAVDTTQFFIGVQTGSNQTWFLRYGDNTFISDLGVKYGYNIVDSNRNEWFITNGSYTFPYEEFQSEHTMYLFGLNYANKFERGFNGKIFSCEIYDNGTLIRDFIPCYRNSDNILGMYDLVNNVFYTNQGTGTFTYGSNASLPNPDFPSKIKNVEGVTNYFDKNLFNKFTHELQYIFLTLKPNTQYTFSTTMDEVKNIGDNIFFINNGEDASSTLNGVNINKSRTITTDSTGKVKIGYRDYNNLLTDEIENYEYQLEKGSVKHKHVPYGRWLEQKTTDRNKFNKDDVLNNIVVNTSGGEQTANNYTTSNYIECLPNTNYAISFNYVSGDAVMRVSCYDKNKNFISRIDNGSTKNYIQKTPSNCYYIRLSFQTSAFNNIQVEEGTATSYEPYKKNTALIDLNKKNLANFETNTTIGNLQVLGNVDTTNQNYITTDYKKVKPNTTYTLILKNTFTTSSTTRRCIEYNSSKEFVVVGATITSSTNEYKTITFTTSSTTEYIRLSKRITDEDVKLYEGVETDDYYSFKEDDTFKDGLYTQKRVKVILNGSESWNRRATILTNSIQFLCNTYQNGIANSNKINAISNILDGIDANTCWATDNVEGIAVDTTIRIRILKSRLNGYSDDLSDTEKDNLFKQWLSENPVEVYYILATPIEHTLDYEVLKLHKGYNNITLNDELEPNMSVIYLTDSKMNAQYATKAEVKVESEKITSEINSTLKNEYTTIEQTNKIEQKITDTENSILLEVSKKVGNDEIISKINQSAEEVQIKAEKISLEGKEINMTSEDILITSDNLTIDKDGKMTIVGGTETEPTFIVTTEDKSQNVNIAGNWVILKNENTGDSYILNMRESGTFFEGGSLPEYERQISIKSVGLYKETFINKIETAWIGTNVTNQTKIRPGEIIVDNPNHEYAANKIIPVQYSSYNSGNVDVATDVNQVLGSGLTLPAGRYIVVTQFSFAANSLGMRRVNIATSSGAGDAHIQQAASPKGVTRIRHTQFLNLTDNTHIYWNCCQTSGSTLSCSATGWIYRIQ